MIILVILLINKTSDDSRPKTPIVNNHDSCPTPVDNHDSHPKTPVVDDHDSRSRSKTPIIDDDANIAGSIPPEGDDYYDYHLRSKTRDDDYYNYRPRPKTHGDDYDYRSPSKTPVINVIDDNSRHTGRGKADDSRHENQPLENLLIK